MTRETFPSLDGLRFLLAFWIAGYHLLLLYGSPTTAEAWWAHLGEARVDLFFALSGFVITHVYARAERPFHFAEFLRARVARLYPLHLVALSLLGVAVLGAIVAGRGAEVEDYTWVGLGANVLMLQSFGVPGVGQWNFPAWTLSAEAFCYLAFPMILAAAPVARRRPLLMLGLTLLGAAALDALWPLWADGPLSEATQNGGWARALVGFAAGAAARCAFDRAQINGLEAVALGVGGLALTFSAATQGWSLALVAAGSGCVVLALAALDRAGAPSPLRVAPLQRVAGWSYALFVLHVPVFVIGARLLALFGWDGALEPISAALLMGAALLLAWPAHVLVEEPARRAIRGRTPRMAQNPSKVAA